MGAAAIVGGAGLGASLFGQITQARAQRKAAKENARRLSRISQQQDTKNQLDQQSFKIQARQQLAGFQAQLGKRGLKGVSAEALIESAISNAEFNFQMLELEGAQRISQIQTQRGDVLNRGRRAERAGFLSSAGTLLSQGGDLLRRSSNA